jgi:hypothetical protein
VAVAIDRLSEYVQQSRLGRRAAGSRKTF